MKICITLEDITAEQLAEIGATLGIESPALVAHAGAHGVGGLTEAPPVETFEPDAPPVEAPEPDAPPVETFDDPKSGVDSAGLPWDERIHARTGAKVADGTWRKKRGVADELVAQVEAELRAAKPAPAPAAPAEPTAPAAPATTAPAAPPEAPAAPAALTAVEWTFPAFMQAQQAAGIDSKALLAACQKHDIASAALLATRPDVIPAVAAELGLGA